MRVFHFLNAHHGVENIQQRRLKVATLNDLNDPFELFGPSLRNEKLRRMFSALKLRAHTQIGLLCFSRDWQNPVMWSHYADRHRGLCLGFDVPEDHLQAVTYSRRRVVLEPSDLDREIRDMSAIMKWLSTKYAHWRYESEGRVFVPLNRTERRGGLHFVKLGETVILKTVIVGARSEVTRQEVSSALGDLAASVEAFKARLAFGTFKVVRQKNDELWR
jgi:hypothetical protein